MRKITGVSNTAVIENVLSVVVPALNRLLFAVAQVPKRLVERLLAVPQAEAVIETRAKVEVLPEQLASYYEQIQQAAYLPTVAHAQGWSAAVLRTLGLNLDRKTKKELAIALPAELSEPLTRPFRLFPFRDPDLSQAAFLKQAALRGGNTDPDFARYPVTAVFRGLKRLVDTKTSERVAQALSPQVRQLWQQA